MYKMIKYDFINILLKYTVLRFNTFKVISREVGETKLLWVFDKDVNFKYGCVMKGIGNLMWYQFT